MVFSLLGSMAAGGAQAYAAKHAAEVNAENKLREKLFLPEIEDEYKKRVEERKAQREQTIYERNRADKLTDAETEFGRITQRDDQQHSRTLERDDLRHKRTLERDDLQHKRNTALSANRRGAAGTSDDAKQLTQLSKDISKLDADIYKIERDLNDPMKIHQREASERYLNRLKQERRDKEQALILADDARESVNFVRADRSPPASQPQTPSIEEVTRPQAKPLLQQEQPPNDTQQEARTLLARRQRILDELENAPDIPGSRGHRTQLEHQLKSTERRLQQIGAL